MRFKRWQGGKEAGADRAVTAVVIVSGAEH